MTAEELAARQFDATFEPKEGVDYGWVVRQAREQYDDLRKAFERLDAKAAALFALTSSLTGAFTIGAVAGVAAAKVQPAVVWWGLLPAAASLAAVVFALLARRPMPVHRPADAPYAVALAEYYRTAEWGEAAFLSQWHLQATLLGPVLRAKSRWLLAASWAAVAAVATSLAPLVAHLIVGPPA